MQGGSDVKTQLLWASQVITLLLCRSGTFEFQKISDQRCIVGGCSSHASDETSLHRFLSREKALASPVVGSWSEKCENRMGWPFAGIVICSAIFGAECFEEQATSSAAINLSAEPVVSYRKRRSFKPVIIPTTVSASNVRRTPQAHEETNNSHQDRESR